MPISRAPRREIISVPGTLKVCGERALAGGCDKQVSAVLEIKCLKIGAVVSALVFFEKLVGGKPGVLKASEIKGICSRD